MLFVFKYIVLHWGTNRECSISQENMVYRRHRKIRWAKHSRFQPYDVFCENTFAI